MPTLPDRLTAAKVRAAVEGADDMELIYALIEPADSIGVGVPTMEEDGFHCPLCSSNPSEWLLHGPSAFFGSEVTWLCCRCGAQGTRWTLIRMVLESPAALSRFLSFPAAA